MSSSVVRQNVVIKGGRFVFIKRGLCDRRSGGSDSQLIWPLIAGSPDQHPDERQFSRLKNHRELADDARIGGQKEGGTGADHVAAAGNYRKDTDDAGDKPSTHDKDAERKKPKAPKNLGQDKALIVEAEEEQDEGVALSLIENREELGTASKGQRGKIVKDVEIGNRNGNQHQDQHRSGVFPTHGLEQAVESQDGENYDGRGEQLARHSEPEKGLRIADIVGGSSCVSPNDQHARDIKKRKGSGKAIQEIERSCGPGLFL